MAKLSFIASDHREYNISRSLSLLKSDIVRGVKAAKNILLLPVCASFDKQDLSTNVDALAAVLEFISPYATKQITLAALCPGEDPLKIFQSLNYFNLRDRYDLAIADLNNDLQATVELESLAKKSSIFNVPKTILESDYIISVAPPKTNSEIYYSGIIDSLCSNAISRPKKSILSLAKVDPKANPLYKEKDSMPENISSLLNKVKISLAILDGYSTMHGDTPNGQLATTHWSIASTDAIAVDYLAVQLLGFNVEDIAYIHYLIQNRTKTSDDIVVGDDWQKNIFKARPHRNFLH